MHGCSLLHSGTFIPFRIDFPVSLVVSCTKLRATLNRVFFQERQGELLEGGYRVRFKALKLDAVFRALVESMLDQKENIDHELVASFRNGNTDSLKLLSKILPGSLQEPLN
ncbi:hypothetical protein GIB67_005846 [Kingdonia uniflora]|uniref:Uncharacterized protein n=1 Tax=Kingdonia uniflora TaxID=39325 RepID=A0A7J7LUH0_9MAGN|nr:hypothetical protein GIB67_005846 [Kingdonia uniflora]